MKYKFGRILLIVLTCLFYQPAFPQLIEFSDTVNTLSFIKDENISGLVLYGQPQNEILRTNSSVENEELFTGSVKYHFGKRHWEILDYQREIAEFSFETGFFGGAGNWRDSSSVEKIEADHSVYGLRTNIGVNYSNRYFFDAKNFTLVEVNAWGNYEIYRQNSEGTVRDSNGVSSVYENEETKDKLRYGFEAKAGWGIGKLSVLNHYMVADYLLDKYYVGRVFSDDEKLLLANKIAEIKHRRNKNSASLTDAEIKEITEFFTSAFKLKAPASVESDWVLGEFLPRYNGNQLEIGPFFNYFSQEPDFVYGGFIRFSNAKYIDRKKNRNFGVALNYNRYKTNDWLQLESDLNWSFYFDLQSRFTIGARYLPAISIEQLENFESIDHSFVPYIEYFTQLNSKMRMDLAFSWNIADREKFTQAGPRIKLGLYRSKY